MGCEEVFVQLERYFRIGIDSTIMNAVNVSREYSINSVEFELAQMRQR